MCSLVVVLGGRCSIGGAFAAALEVCIYVQHEYLNTELRACTRDSLVSGTVNPQINRDARARPTF